MKNILLIIFAVFNYCISYSQEIHLSYNLYGEKNAKVVKEKSISFFIGENNFLYKKNKHFYKSIRINKKLTYKIVNIESFLKKAYQLKISRIKKSRKILVSKKSKIFKKIFLYEKKDNYINIYCVDWLDVIID